MKLYLMVAGVAVVSLFLERRNHPGLPVRKSNIQAQDTTMTESAPPDVKRRRLAAAVSTSLGTTTCFSDLPSGILAHAASF